MIFGIIVGAIVLLVIIIFVVSYNGLVRTRNRIENAWSQIDVQLRRRYDLIPNLVETVKGYAAHERGVFESVTQARANAINAEGPAQQAQAENVLSGALKSLFAVAEAYPDLKANQNFLNLQEELTSTEDRVAYARQFYNDSVLNYNNKIQSLPTSIIAGMFNFEKRVYFEAEPEATGPVRVQFEPPTQGAAGEAQRASRAESEPGEGASARGPGIPARSERRPAMYEQIARNKRRTFVILAFFVVLVALVALAFNYLIDFGIVGVVIAVLIAFGMAFFSYFYSDKVALAASRAKPADGPEYQRYHNLIEGLCIAAGLPKPRLYIVVDAAPNAFATGRNPKHATIAVTTGLLNTMNRVELEGVLAHELSHIKNYDILVGTVAVTAVGALALLADLGLRFMWFGGGRRDSDSSNNGFGAILAIFALVLLVLAPFIAQIMQFAMSRKRELLADASGVQLTRYPPGLISALEKLKGDHAVVHNATRATAQLWIESPLDREKTEEHKRTWLNRAFDTHPPLDERIRILKEM